MGQSSLLVTALFVYPVKSLRGCSVSRCAIDSLGLVGDRRFMVVDEAGNFLTQRTMPRMALINTTLSESSLTLSHDGHGSVVVSTGNRAVAAIRQVRVWSSGGLTADDCGNEAAEWLSVILGVKCRLVRIGDGFRRPIIHDGKPSADDLVSFADAYPLLILGESSLADLNERLIGQGGEALPLSRFRPNVVFSGGEAFSEDRWHRFRIGDVTFRTTGPCARCSVTTIDPQTGQRGVEPLRTLATYRRNPVEKSEVEFGQNLVNESKSGTLRVGDAIEVLA